MQLAPSIRRLGTSSLVNSYLVEDDSGITIIDAGLPGLWSDLRRELAVIGRPIEDVRALLLTHADVDHVGFAERLRREAGVPVYVGAADAPRARGEGAGKSAATRDPIRLGPALGFFAFGLTHGGLRSTPIAEVTPISGRLALDVPGSPEIIPLPGHTPGSVAYRFSSADAIFMGDAMTTRSVVSGVVGPALGPFTVDPAQALASLGVLEEVEAGLVLPGHGDPWTGGLEAAVRRIRESEEHRAAA
jgi:glyoxylase-like metal-dependent hydrolase (beta-lactamase superfamily II)